MSAPRKKRTKKELERDSKRKKETAEKFLKETTASKTQNNLPHLVDMYEAIISEFGGTQEFAETLVWTFKQAASGSSQQARILESVLRGVELLFDRGLTGSTDEDPEAMSDEELEKYMKDVVHGVLEEMD